MIPPFVWQFEEQKLAVPFADVDQLVEPRPMTIAVIMVTASEQVTMAAEALRSGAFGYVPKPFDFRYLDHMEYVDAQSYFDHYLQW